MNSEMAISISTRYVLPKAMFLDQLCTAMLCAKNLKTHTQVALSSDEYHGEYLADSRHTCELSTEQSPDCATQFRPVMFLVQPLPGSSKPAGSQSRYAS